jgi:uncharacterized membrane protein YhiD involved in acid resistance
MILNTATTYVRANWSWIRLVLVGIAFLLLVIFLVSQMQSCYSNYEINKNKEAINAEVGNAVNINANIANLQEQDIQKNAEIKQQVKEHEKIKTARQDQQKVTNRALDNVNVIRNTNFNNSSYSTANEARCEAYPDSAECSR